jgi:hypothetical protein
LSGLFPFSSLPCFSACLSQLTGPVAPILRRRPSFGWDLFLSSFSYSGFSTINSIIRRFFLLVASAPLLSIFFSFNLASVPHWKLNVGSQRSYIKLTNGSSLQHQASEKAQNRMRIGINCPLSTNFHPTEHAFTALQALNRDESLTNFHPNIHAAQRHKTG